jgi:hypothetical protein
VVFAAFRERFGYAGRHLKVCRSNTHAELEFTVRIFFRRGVPARAIVAGVIVDIIKII